MALALLVELAVELVALMLQGPLVRLQRENP
jgi:hypothetical protein